MIGLPPPYAVEIQPFRDVEWVIGGGKGKLHGQSQILLADGVCWIGIAESLWAIVDEADFPLIAGCTWGPHRGNKTTYATSLMDVETTGHGRKRLHRIIMGSPRGALVDHADKDGLNNRRKNLRCCNTSQNLSNRGANANNKCGIKGVHFRKDISKWQARIQVNGKYIHLGVHEEAEKARAAYQSAAVKFHGEFARTE